MEDGDRRRSREDYGELDRLLLEADGALEAENLRGANVALKKAEVKAASMWGEVGRPALPGHFRQLVGLVRDVQGDLGRSGQSALGASRKGLSDLRSRFEIEARRDARGIAL